MVRAVCVGAIRQSTPNDSDEFVPTCLVWFVAMASGSGKLDHVATIVDYLNRVPLVGLMLVTAAGYTLGRCALKNLSLGPAGGTLLVALVFGYCGVTMEGFYGTGSRGLTIGTLGFVLFIYSVGFEAGPRFFSSFGTRDGWRFVVVGVTVNVLAVTTAVIYGKAFGLDGATVAGLLSGALTSASTFAAASHSAADQSLLSVAFVITYPVGLVALVIAIQSLPGQMRESLATGATSADDDRRRAGARPRAGSAEISRAFEVALETLTGVALRGLDLTHRTGCVLTRVARADQIMVPDGDTTLAVGDRILAVGRVDELRELATLVGPEIPSDDLVDGLPKPRRVQVRQRAVLSKSLAELDLIRRFQCIVTRVQRGAEWLEPAADLILEYHDIVEVSGARDDVRRAARFLGRFESSLDETNIAIYTGGIFLGLLIGSIPLGADVTVGTATGLLMAGIALGWIGRIGLYSTDVPASARHLIRDLGILLFISETGLTAGAKLVDGFLAAPWITLFGALIVMVVTVVGALVVGSRLLKLRALDAWGSVCGGLTSSAALQTLRRAADTNDVTVSYAAAYTIASVLATIAGQFVIQLF